MMPKKGYKQTLEHRRNSSIAMIQKYENGYVHPMKGCKLSEAHLEKLKESAKNPEVRKKRSEAQKKRYADPKERKKASENAKLRLNTPEERERLFNLWKSPERRKAQSERAKKEWDNPEKKKLRVDKMRETARKPERRKKISKSVKKSWKDAEKRKKHLDAMSDPVYRECKSQIMKKYWEDPEKRKKHSERMSGSNHPNWIEDRELVEKKKAMQQMVTRYLKMPFTSKVTDELMLEKLGYTKQQFIGNIENLWELGMNWQNRGRGLDKWHIDHIKPVSAFLKEGVIDPKIINALDNLQPLWEFDNLSKGAKYNKG